MKVALISGTSITRSSLFAGWESAAARTLHGEAAFLRSGGHIVLNRHGPDGALPPHSINHRANIRALADQGCTDIISLNSVGSLQPGLRPGTFVSCSDYICLQSPPCTFFDREFRAGRPGIANNLIPQIIAAAPEPVLPGKIYVQTRGPRFETPAEVRILSTWGDVVGMTLAHEADLCTELGINYNSLAIVDNHANGIEGASIDLDTFRGHVRANQERIDALLRSLLELFP